MTLEDRSGQRVSSRSVLSFLATLIFFLSFSFLYYSADWLRGRTFNTSSLHTLKSAVDIHSGIYKLGLVCPSCLNSFTTSTTKRTCQKRIRRVLNQNNGLGAIGAKLSYLEAAIYVASRADLNCQGCDPVSCSDKEKRYYHTDKVGPKVVRKITPALRLQPQTRSLLQTRDPDFQRMNLVNPAIVEIPNYYVRNMITGGVFLCSYLLVEECKRVRRGGNSTFHLAISILDANLTSINHDGVFKTPSDWVVLNENNMLYLANARHQAPLVVDPRLDIPANPSLSAVAASPRGSFGLTLLTSNTMERRHRVDPKMFASIMPSFGTSDQLSDDNGNVDRIPIALACCAEFEWRSEKVTLGVAGYRHASRFFVLNEVNEVVALTGNFCFTSDCAHHRVHSIVRAQDGNIIVAYEERCSSLLLLLETADVMRMLFEPHERFP